MILIITHKEDFTADYVINILNDRKIEYRRLNCEDMLKNKHVIKVFDEFQYSILGESNFKSIWFRRTKLPLIKMENKYESIYLLNEFEALFKNLFASIKSNWLSNPNAIYQSENKLLQLKTAKKLGFNIPKTLITNDHDAVLNFYQECLESIIIKPLSQTRIQYKTGSEFIFTNPISKSTMANLPLFDLTPCIFQEEITKEYEIRVTVIGTKIFSAKVDSQSDIETKNDWRKKKLKFEKYTLPAEIELKCVKLLKILDLKFGAIDFIKNKNGEYIFLEINPNGQWAWIEMQTGLKISDAIINYLQHEN